MQNYVFCIPQSPPKQSTMFSRSILTNRKSTSIILLFTVYIPITVIFASLKTASYFHCLINCVILRTATDDYFFIYTGTNFSRQKSLRHTLTTFAIKNYFKVFIVKILVRKKYKKKSPVAALNIE